VQLAKPALDVGIYTHDREPMLEFWQQDAGVAFDELLRIGGGVQQHRHRIGHSILKINHSREPLVPAAAGGYRCLRIAHAGLGESRQLQDPNGNPVELVSPGTDGIGQLELTVAVRSLEAHRHFYEQVLRLDRIDADRFRCGDSILALREDSLVEPDPVLAAPGYRYITFQVYDVLFEHATILERGGREGRSPIKLGDVAYISFVRDPDGNWIEISQRKSLTGSLGSGDTDSSAPADTDSSVPG
jgi:lactoylglutathione lyase